MFGRKLDEPGGDAYRVVGFCGWSLSGRGSEIGVRSQQSNQPRSFQHGTTIDLHGSCRLVWREPLSEFVIAIR